MSVSNFFKREKGTAELVKLKVRTLTSEHPGGTAKNSNGLMDSPKDVVQRTIFVCNDPPHWDEFYLTQHFEEPPFGGTRGQYVDTERDANVVITREEAEQRMREYRRNNAMWDITELHSSFTNCINYATGGQKTSFGNLGDARQWMNDKGLEETTDERAAIVVLFATGREDEAAVEHAMRKASYGDELKWHEVGGFGAGRWRYMGRWEVPSWRGGAAERIMFRMR